MAGLGIWMVVGLVSVAGIETPEYEVVSRHEGYEIREYEPYIAAEVTMEGDFRRAMNGGFRTLADYIFGNNAKAGAGDTTDSESIAMTAPVIEREAPSENIAMTAPVTEQQTKSGARVVSFIMPSEYTMETIPKPNNPDVTLVEMPAQRFAAHRFSGRVPLKKADTKKQFLLDALTRDGVATEGAPMLAQYNPPWTPPFMRRNEVLILVKDEVPEE